MVLPEISKTHLHVETTQVIESVQPDRPHQFDEEVVFSS